MAPAAHGLADLPDVLPHGITTHAMRVEFTSTQITLFLFIVVAIVIGVSFMVYLFVCYEGKLKPELGRPRDDHWIWPHENSSSSAFDLL
jgi:hypothetical protein